MGKGTLICRGKRELIKTRSGRLEGKGRRKMLRDKDTGNTRRGKQLLGSRKEENSNQSKERKKGKGELKNGKGK